MTRQEWIEYFEALNSRKPKPNELWEAERAGEFITTPTSQQASQQNQEASSQPTGQMPNAQEPVAQERVDNQAVAPQQEPAVSQANQAVANQNEPVNQASLAQDGQGFSQVGQTEAVQPAQNFQGMPQAQQGQNFAAANPQVPNQQALANSAPQANWQNAAQTPLSQPVKKKRKFRKSFLVYGLVVLVLIAGAAFGAYRYQTGNIEGTWVMTKQKSYNYYTNKFDIEKYDKDDAHYVKVTKNGKLTFNLGIEEPYKVNPLMRRIATVGSDKELLQLQKENDKKVYGSAIDTYGNKYGFTYGPTAGNDPWLRISYKVSGDTLTLTEKNRTGKTVVIATYKRLSASKAKKAEEQALRDIEDAREDYEGAEDD